MKKVIDGNYACSLGSYHFTEVAGIYPITPSSQMAELIDQWSNQNQLNFFNDQVKVVQMQSEAGAAAMMHGSLSAGLLSTTYTASQGLLLMIPNIYKMVGEMLPGVFHVSARSISTHALSIFGDHQDIYATRMTGISILASSSVQDAYYMSIIAHLTAIKSSLPILHFFDGFRTSHELAKINVFEKETYFSLMCQESITNFRKNSLHPNKSITKGTAQNDDIYFQNTESRNKYHQQVVTVVQEYMTKINQIANTNYQPFNYYGAPDAESVIVAMGSVNETIKETIDYLNQKIGLIEVHLYRPFSAELLKSVIPKTVKRIAVLDRTKEPGSQGEPLYLDIVAALKDEDIEIVGGRYGLSSKNMTPSHIEAIYQMLQSQLKNPFTVGIDDDVTFLSLKPTSLKIKNSLEFLIYGYGSDGMVTAAKSIIKIVGESANVQGYFQYDSKKSGGVTICHLRFSKNEIKSAYYVENPKLIVVTKESYFKKYNILDNICDEGALLINTNRLVFDLFSKQDVENIKKKKIKLYRIDANKLARENNLRDKISTIIEVAIYEITKIVNPEEARAKIKERIKDDFISKGDEVVKNNQLIVDMVKENIFSLEIPEQGIEYIKEDSFLEKINRLEGNELKVSEFNPKGEFIGGTTKTEKREVADLVPKWLNEHCIQCNMCSFVCPHAVIRPFHLSEEEYQKAPDYVQKKAIKPLEPNLSNYYFIIGISVKDCTGCGLCINKCPGRNNQKALTFKQLNEELNEQQVADYLFNNITNKHLVNEEIIKGTQFNRPRFEFSGACAGCGETPYLKLLTQLFGDRLIIANATGCSSIYGGTAPSTPYDIPWASSLFEDNAEYGYGMQIAYSVARKRLEKIMNQSQDENKDLYNEWISHKNDYQITQKVYQTINYEIAPKEINDLKEYIPARTVWAIGGDGWAYDIGFGGIDHVLASNDNINLLVLDTQVYSNTGGQSSKASTVGSIAPFAGKGKSNYRKDLAKIALTYENVYVAQVSLGANGMQLIKAFKEAEAFDGPSIIIAYSPCIAHGIKGGMGNSISNQELAVGSGFFPIFRYNSALNKFTLDSQKVDFSLYQSFLESQTRFAMLKKINPDEAEMLLEKNQAQAEKTFNYYLGLEKDCN